MLIRGSPNSLRHPHPQLVAIPEWVVAIRRNGWSPSIGMLEGSNRSRVPGIDASSARDLFEAGLNEAASG
jgi:hypothetical protein